MADRGLKTVCTEGMGRLYWAYIGFLIIGTSFLMSGTGGINSKNILEGIIEENTFEISRKDLELM